MSHLKYMFYFIQMCEMSWRNALISISDWSKMMSVCMTHSTLKGGEGIHRVYEINVVEAAHSLTVSMMSVKKPKGTTGSGSSRKKSFKAPVMTWMSSQSLSSKFSFSSERWTGEAREGEDEGNGEKFTQTGQGKWTKGEAIWNGATKSEN